MNKRTMMCILIAVLSVGMLSAQETRGTIVGRIIDPSGGVIPGATVVVTNTAMGTNSTSTTNAVGMYQAMFLIPGI